MTTIGFVGPLPPTRSGIAQHGARLVEALRSTGQDVHAVSWSAQYPALLFRRPQVDPAATLEVESSRSLRWSSPWTWRRAAKSLDGVERLVMPWAVPVHAPAQLQIARALDVPLTILVHNSEPHERLPGARAAARALFRQADRLVVHAESEARRCRALAPDVPVSVVPMPANLRPVVRPLPDVRPIRLLCQGFVRPYKGFDLALRALRVLVDHGHDVRLTIAGEVWDGDTGAWEQLVADLGLDDVVDLRLDYATDQALVEQMADHHILLAPYRSATQSGVVAQALAAGRPVVATDVGGLPELVEHDRNGVVVAPDDVNALAGGVLRVAHSIRSFAAEALASAATWDDVAARVSHPLSVVGEGLTQ